MIIKEETVIGGRSFLRSWSDTGVYIKDNQGRKFVDVVDRAELGREYVETDEPIPSDQRGEVMKYSTLSIKRELAKLGKWDAAKALIETRGAWDDYILANYLAETDPVFVAAKTAFVSARILTQAQLDELLPKCIWTAE